MTQSHFFHSLEGSWQVKKTITHFNQQQDHLYNGVGKAVFTSLSPDWLRYKETVCLSDQNRQWEGFQTYLYHYDKGHIDVYFDQNPPIFFFHLQFASTSYAYSHHLCACDSYEAFYQKVSSTEFVISYHVTGPRKNYISKTRLLKISSP